MLLLVCLGHLRAFLFLWLPFGSLDWLILFNDASILAFGPPIHVFRDVLHHSFVWACSPIFIVSESMDVLVLRNVLMLVIVTAIWVVLSEWDSVHFVSAQFNLKKKDCVEQSCNCERSFRRLASCSSDRKWLLVGCVCWLKALFIVYPAAFFHLTRFFPWILPPEAPIYHSKWLFLLLTCKSLKHLFNAVPLASPIIV